MNRSKKGKGCGGETKKERGISEWAFAEKINSYTRNRTKTTTKKKKKRERKRHHLGQQKDRSKDKKGIEGQGKRKTMPFVNWVMDELALNWGDPVP